MKTKQLNSPQFLTTIPEGQDRLGNSQEKLAQVICHTIQHPHPMDKKVIGILGEWGSGKSNLITMIEKNLGKEYDTFIFDAWGNQEDLTRRSFLEQLIAKLFPENEKWKGELKLLLAKTSKKHREIFPEIKLYWLFFSLFILLMTFLPGLYENVLKKWYIISESIYEPTIAFLCIYALPIVALIIAIAIMVKEYKQKVKENNNLPPNEQETIRTIRLRMFYWFNGKEINSKEIENIIENEPSVKEFKDYFSRIEADLKKQKRKLLIVFDNLDRLESSKVKSLWSSIHTFFADDYTKHQSWVIIPYDKEKLLCSLESTNEHERDKEYKEAFLQKNFTVNFRITPPVVVELNNFFQEKLDMAFPKDLITKEDKNYIIKLFDLLTPGTTIKPRQVINYINNLVATYIQWKDQIKSGDIPIKYLALSILTQDQILKSPTSQILSREYLSKANILFEDDNKLDTIMATIIFGVPSDMADEILLERTITQAFRNGDASLIQEALRHPAFEYYFDKVYTGMPLEEKITSIPEIFKVVESKFNNIRMNSLWTNYTNAIIQREEQFTEFSNYHRATIKNAPTPQTKKILRRVVRDLASKTENKEQQRIYYQQLRDIQGVLDFSNKKMTLKDLVPSSTVIFDPEVFFEAIDPTTTNYHEYNIRCKPKALVPFFRNGADQLDTDKILKNLDLLNLIKKEHDFKEITTAVRKQIQDYTGNQFDTVDKSLHILKTLEKNPVKIQLSSSLRNAAIDLNNLKTKPVQIDLFCIKTAQLNTTFKAPTSKIRSFLKANRFDDELVRKITETIPAYMDYGNLLLLVANTNNSYQLLKEITRHWTDRQEIIDTDQYLQGILKNFTDIEGHLFNNNKKHVEQWLRKMQTIPKYQLSVSQVSESLFDYFNLQEVPLIRKLTEQAIALFKKQSERDIFEAFQVRNKVFYMIKTLVENDLMEKGFTQNFYNAYHKYYIHMASTTLRDMDNPKFWDNLVDQLNGNKLKTTFTQVRDFLIAKSQTLNVFEMYFFGKGLIHYGNLSVKNDEAMTKIIIPMIKCDDVLKEVILPCRQKVIKIITASEKYREEIKKTLDSQSKIEIFKDDNRIMEMVKAL